MDLYPENRAANQFLMLLLVSSCLVISAKLHSEMNDPTDAAPTSSSVGDSALTTDVPQTTSVGSPPDSLATTGGSAAREQTSAAEDVIRSGDFTTMKQEETSLAENTPSDDVITMATTNPFGSTTPSTQMSGVRGGTNWVSDENGIQDSVTSPSVTQMNRTIGDLFENTSESIINVTDAMMYLLKNGIMSMQMNDVTVTTEAHNISKNEDSTVGTIEVKTERNDSHAPIEVTDEQTGDEDDDMTTKDPVTAAYKEIYRITDELSFGFFTTTLVVDGSGLVMNGLSLAVLWKMRSSVSNTYILILTALDTTYLVFSVPSNIIKLVLPTLAHSPRVYEYYKYYVETPLMYASRHIVSFVTSVMALDRFVKIAFPWSSGNKNLLNRPKAISIVVSIFVLAYTYIYMAIRRRLVDDFDPDKNITTVKYEDTDMFIQNVQIINLTYLVVSCFISYLPPLVLIFSNVSLVACLALHSRRMRARQLTCEAMTIARARSVRSAKIVLVYSVVFLLLYLPLLASTVLSFADLGLDITALNPGALAVWGLSLPLLDSVNSSIGFIVLLAANSVFRRGVKVLIFQRAFDAISTVSATGWD